MASMLGLRIPQSLIPILKLESGPLPLYTYYLPAFFGLITVAQALPPSSLRVPATLPFLALLTTQFCLHRWKASPQNTGPIGVWVFHMLFMYVDRVVLANPDKEKWHKVGKVGQNNQKSDVKKASPTEDGKKLVPKTFRERLWWSFSSMIGIRGIGWNWQVRDLPSSLNITKWTFVLNQAVLATLLHFATVLMVYYAVNTPYGAFLGDEKPVIALSQGPISEQIGFTALLLVMHYVGMLMLGGWITTATLLLGLAEPEDCRPLMGSLTSGYTVRNSWSVVWHQLFRRTCTWTGNYMAIDILRLRRRRAAARYVKVFTAFFVSAVCHALGSYVTTGSGVKCNMIYFMMQPLAILLEEQVIALGKRAGLKDGPLWRTVGYVWTIVWFLYSTRMLWDDSVESELLLFPWKPWDPVGIDAWIKRWQSK